MHIGCEISVWTLCFGLLDLSSAEFLWGHMSAFQLSNIHGSEYLMSLKHFPTFLHSNLLHVWSKACLRNEFLVSWLHLLTQIYTYYISIYDFIGGLKTASNWIHGFDSYGTWNLCFWLICSLFLDSKLYLV